MGREKRKAGPGAASGRHAKERHKKDRKGNAIDWSAPLPPGLVARPERPRVSSKHKSWFEFMENKDKKKKLEIQVTETREPPPGFEFVPIGNPSLTTLCKELSRERGAMIFIVTSRNGIFSQRLSLQLNRVGHHIRQMIVDEARQSLGDSQLIGDAALLGLPEPIPERQEDINAQADAAIRDLFPRIPNTDRQMIIEHAFNKSKVTNPDSPPVGLAAHLTLSRRVQMAVLAHIRHNHTRYDQLLKETSYVNARKAVESLCLDFLVKWRGDEETGRDQLDEILCEVIVISDSESSGSDSDDDSDDSTDDDEEQDESARDGELGRAGAFSRPLLPSPTQPSHPHDVNYHRADELSRPAHHRVRKNDRRDREKKEAKWAKRGFNRYQAVRDQAWNQAVERQRQEQNHSSAAAIRASIEMSRPAASLDQHPQQAGQSEHLDLGVDATRSPQEPPHRARHRSFGTSLHHAAEFVRPAHSAAFDGNHQRVVSDDGVRGSGAGPIVGLQALDNWEVERPGQYVQRSEDQPLQSIESVSPRGYPIQSRTVETGLTDGAHPSRVTYCVMMPAGRAPEPQEYHTRQENPGFIQLPPRSNLRRLPHPAPTLPKDSQYVGTAEQYSPSTYRDSEGRLLRAETRPIWVDQDGQVLRSSARPIYIPDHTSTNRQPRLDPAHTYSDEPVSIPIRTTDGAHHMGHGQGQVYERQRVEGRKDQFVMDQLPDNVQIVRVKDKFPRQYNPEPREIELREQRLAYDTVPFDHTRYPSPSRSQRVETVVGGYEQPVSRQANGDTMHRVPESYRTGSQRVERVVGYEVIPTHVR
ncbi:hypothetical protein QBC42DRAFT_185256 [Cladorrhinum samala]|uniref:DUF2293 domain-containing protein n=1 Tax=Cladorrhinum samala TaxID=585594 RepID=A0AAV9HD65_9PEZI|nr:hypothetical protein QBC42DRAFT_185256 [Cladorrhinum samala]